MSSVKYFQVVINCVFVIDRSGTFCDLLVLVCSPHEVRLSISAAPSNTPSPNSEKTAKETIGSNGSKDGKLMVDQSLKAVCGQPTWRVSHDFDILAIHFGT